MRATLRVLAEAGIPSRRRLICGRSLSLAARRYRARDYTVPGDVPSAAALAVASILLGQPAQLATLDASQRETVALLAALAAFGAPVTLADGVLAWHGGTTPCGRRWMAIR